jgi:hypothetical protein
MNIKIMKNLSFQVVKQLISLVEKPKFEIDEDEYFIYCKYSFRLLKHINRADGLKNNYFKSFISLIIL